MTTLQVDELTLAVRRSPRRRTIEIVVDRDGDLLIVAPSGCPDETLAEFVSEKRFWIYQKLAAKHALVRAQPDKQFVSGEGFYYLGRSYRLLLVDEQNVALKLEQGRFKLRRDRVPDGRDLLVQWYSERARGWIRTRLERWTQRVGAEPDGVEVRDLGFRWGSRGVDRRLYFHWRAILLPPEIIDYLLVHELVHLVEPQHTPSFWKRVERTVCDFDQRKEWLAVNGCDYAL